MGLISGKSVNHKEKQNNKLNAKLSEVMLTTEELDVLIAALSTSTFHVKRIEVLYTAIVKLQEQRKIVSNEDI